MTVYQDGYYCSVCGKTVRAKLWWSNEEDELVASCTLCGELIQRVIPQPFSQAAFMPLGRPGPNLVSNPTGAPAHTQEANK